MTKNIQTAEPATTVIEIARMMKEGDFGVMPVTENERVVGMVTDRDIVVRGVAKGQNPEEITAKDVMTTGVRYCFEDDDLDEVIQDMGDIQVRRLVVLDHNKHLVGILALADIAQSQDKGEAAQALNKISQPVHHEPQSQNHH